MSASRKKMLRREETKAAMTERQQQEKKEASKLRLYTAIFTVAMIAVILFVAVSAILGSGIVERNTTALTVNGEKVSAVELNYFYIDNVNSFMNTYGSYADLMGLDTTKSLNDQHYDVDAGTTWADYFLDTATDSAKRVYTLYQEAKANNYQLPAEAQEEIDSTVETLDNYGILYGFADADGYIKAMYGAGASEKSFVDYMTVQYTAENYYNDYLDGLEFTPEQIRAQDEANAQNYNSYSYNYYYLAASKFYQGGTDAEDGTTTYTDAEKAAGQAECKSVAESLAKSANVDELNASIASLEINAGTNAVSTSIVGRQYTGVDIDLQAWVTDPSRSEGDTTVIENTTTTTAEDGTETTAVNGYYVVMFNGSSDNKVQLVNVRHILVSYEGGTTDENGVTTYTDEEKAAALSKAQELLDTFLAGEATEEAFATLANENSTDPGSNTTGGLYENVYPGQTVTNFNNWCFDSSRMAGDTGIVETEYGCHIMYFSSYADTNYRDYMITNELRTAALGEWETALMEGAVLEVVNTSKVNKDLMVSGS